MIKDDNWTTRACGCVIYLHLRFGAAFEPLNNDVVVERGTNNSMAIRRVQIIGDLQYGYNVISGLLLEFGGIGLV